MSGKIGLKAGKCRGSEVHLPPAQVCYDRSMSAEEGAFFEKDNPEHAAQLRELSRQKALEQERLFIEAASFASNGRIMNLIMSRTTMDIGEHTPDSIQKLCEGIRSRFIKQILKGNQIDDNTILNSIARNSVRVHGVKGRKRRGKPGMGEKAARDRS